MPIQIPERKIAPPRQGMAVRSTVYPAPAQKVGYELQRLGKTLQGIGGNWGDLAVRLAKMNATNEALDAENEYNKGYNEFAEDLSKDSDYAGRPDRYVKWHEETTRDIMSRVKSPNAQRMLKNSFAKHKNTKHAQIYLQSQEFLRQETKVNFDIWETEKEREWASATPEGQADVEYEYEEKLKELEDDGMLAPGEYEKRLNDFHENSQKRAFKDAVRSVRVRLKEMLAVQGEDETLKEILNEKNFPELEALEYEKGEAAEARQDLALDVRQRARLFEKEYFRQKTESLKGVIDDVIDKVSKDEPVEKAEVDEITPPSRQEAAMSEHDKKLKKNRDLNYIAEKTKEIREAPSREGYKPEAEVVTDWAVRTELEDDVLKHLLDVVKMDEAAANIAESKMKIKIAHQYKANQKLAKGDYDYLIKLMALDWKDKREDYILFLQKGWENIKETGFVGWPWGEAESEKKAILNSRRALLQWMQAEIARKKEIKLPDVIAKSKELLISAKSGKLGTTVYPKASEEMLKAARQALDEVKKEKLPEAPSKESDEYQVWQEVRNKWYKIPVNVRVEITTALNVTNPTTGNKFTWNEIVADETVARILREIE